MSYVSGHSYGASVPSLDMQSRMRQNPPAWRARVERRKDLDLIAPLVLESVHPDNLGPLPPSPVTIIRKAWQIGLVTSTDPVYGIVLGYAF